MCILFVYVNPSPEEGTYRLILISNRDEYYVRPAQDLTHLKEDEIIAGLDMEPGREGGMWLGVSSKKTDLFKVRVGALLNISGEVRVSGRLNRGAIVADYLKGTHPAEKYVDKLNNNGDYKPHHFVAVELSDDDCTILHSSNVPKVTNKILGCQLLGFGNSPVEDPFEKVKAGRERFKTIVEKLNSTQKKEALMKELVDLLKWEQKHLPDAELQKRIDLFHPYLSSIYVTFLEGGYGTRAHSVVLVDQNWNVDFSEIAMEQPIIKENPTWIANNVQVKL